MNPTWDQYPEELKARVRHLIADLKDGIHPDHDALICCLEAALDRLKEGYTSERATPSAIPGLPSIAELDLTDLIKEEADDLEDVKILWKYGSGD